MLLYIYTNDSFDLEIEYSNMVIAKLSEKEIDEVYQCNGDFVGVGWYQRGVISFTEEVSPNEGINVTDNTRQQYCNPPTLTHYTLSMKKKFNITALIRICHTGQLKT